MNIKKNSYLKFNYDISVVNLQKVVDFCEENDIEYKELYETDLEQQISQLQQEKEETIKLIENLKQFYIEDVKNINFIPLSNFTKNINILLSKLKESDKNESN